MPWIGTEQKNSKKVPLATKKKKKRQKNSLELWGMSEW